MRSAGPGDGGAGERADVLVEGDVDRVERRGDRVERTIVEAGALPKPRAVHVRGRPDRMRPIDLGDEVVPRRQLSTEVALRQLEEEHCRRLGDRRGLAGLGAEVVDADECCRGCQRLGPRRPCSRSGASSSWTARWHCGW